MLYLLLNLWRLSYLRTYKPHLFLNDNSAPDHDIPVIKDDRLTGRDGALRFIKLDLEKVGFRLCDGAGLLLVAVADLGAAAERAVDAVHGDQIDPAAESPALAERVVNDTFVAPQDITLRVHKIAGRTLRAAVALDEAGVVAVRYKADILTVVLLRVFKSAFRGDFSGLGLVLVAERELHVSKLLL